MKKAPSKRSHERMDACVAGILERFPASREAVIPMLQAVQAQLGYLSSEAIQRIAAHLRMSEAAVQGIATFYAQFHFEAPGKHRITICRGTACHVRGSGQLQEEVCSCYGLQPGKTSADGMFTLETVACFGACALAPVVVIDGKVTRQQTVRSLKQAIDELRSESRKPAGRKVKRGRGKGEAHVR